MNMNVKVKRQETMVKNVIGYPRRQRAAGRRDHRRRRPLRSSRLRWLRQPGRPRCKGKIHHGADDNGSGTTTVIELARRFGAMKDREGRRMVFMTFTAEERGLIGSRHYCTSRAALPLEEHRGDGQSRHGRPAEGRRRQDGAKSKLLVLGIDTGKGFEELVKKLNPGFDMVKDKSVFGASDHFSFYQQKIPVLFFFTGIHPDYHRPTDTADKINVPGMKRVADFAERIIDELAHRSEAARICGHQKPVHRRRHRGARAWASCPTISSAAKASASKACPPDGPAEQAGIKKGDIILEIAGKAIPERQWLHVGPGRRKKAGPPSKSRFCATARK